MHEKEHTAYKVLLTTPPHRPNHKQLGRISPIPCNLEASVESEGSSSGTAEAPDVGEEQEDLFDKIWQEVDEFQNAFAFAKRFEESAVQSENCDSDDEYPECFALQKEVCPVMGRLPCGDLHICKVGRPCPYLEPNEDRVLVCKYTGLEHGPEQTDEFFDLNGGTGKKSGDPDQSCGELLHGKFVRRADPTQASRLAFNMAKQISEVDYPGGIPDASLESTPVRPIKRGALCVGESSDTRLVKRNKSNKKDLENSETKTHLHEEAESVITKMINYTKSTTFKQKVAVGKSERKCAPVDPRMLDETFVFTKSVQKYVKACTMAGISPSLDTIHNLAVMAKEISTKAREQNIATSDDIRTAKFRNLCSSLIVALWTAACTSPYMRNSRRGSDAFRPFICGVLYAFKRGITLTTGTVLVPQCTSLSGALPVLRGTGGNTVAKSLHSSSHRGLCTLSRCIASVPKHKQDEHFGGVTRIAAQFASTTFSSNDI